MDDRVRRLSAEAGKRLGEGHPIIPDQCGERHPSREAEGDVSGVLKSACIRLEDAWSPRCGWWIRVGLLPELIEPGHPEQNGRHERIHCTLKRETLRPPAATARAQQRVFDRFRNEFNEARPHEALGQCTPAERYTASRRPYPRRLPALEYPAQCEVRRVSRNGGIRWKNHWVNVSHVLAEEYIAFDEIDDGLWQVTFGPVVLGRFHERLLAIEDEHGRLARHHRTSGNTRKVLPMSSD